MYFNKFPAAFLFFLYAVNFVSFEKKVMRPEQTVKSHILN